jgi:RNA polymerase sigma factor (sigma-70 family)
MESATYVPGRPSRATTGAATFATTHWSAVALAADPSSSGAEALEQLCKTYWYPLYAYIRRQGHAPEEAQDLTQSFFARLLAKGYLANADRERGRFRTFLLSSLQRFLINEWQKASARKRGGGEIPISWDDPEAENRYLAEGVEPASPEKLFEKRWALALLEQVLARLEAEFVQACRGKDFEHLKVLLWGEKSAPPYAQVAAQIGITENALKMAVHRLRRRYRELLRAEVARTVLSPAEVDEELRYLISIFSS